MQVSISSTRSRNRLQEWHQEFPPSFFWLCFLLDAIHGHIFAIPATVVLFKNAANPQRILTPTPHTPPPSPEPVRLGDGRFTCSKCRLDFNNMHASSSNVIHRLVFSRRLVDKLHDDFTIFATHVLFSCRTPPEKAENQNGQQAQKPTWLAQMTRTCLRYPNRRHLTFRRRFERRYDHLVGLPRFGCFHWNSFQTVVRMIRG